MANPIVHFEIIGKNPTALSSFYAALFGWEADTNTVVAPEISETGKYGFIQNAADDGKGVPGGIGGGDSFEPHILFYVGVENVEETLEKAKELGSKRVLGPIEKPDGGLIVGHIEDPEGNLIGVASSGEKETSSRLLQHP